MIENNIHNYENDGNEKNIPQKEEIELNVDKKDILKTIDEFKKEYAEKIKILEEKLWQLGEKIKKNMTENDFLNSDAYINGFIWQIESVSEKIQSFIYPQVNDKIKSFNKYIDDSYSLIDDILTDKKFYSDNVFDDLNDSIISIFNYNDYDYVDIDLDKPRVDEMFDYIKNKTNDRTRIFISKLENIRFDKYEDLDYAVASFVIKLNGDLRYDYILEKIFKNNSGLIKEFSQLTSLMENLENRPDLMEIYIDIIDNDQNLSLLSIEFILSRLNNSYYMLSNIVNETDKKEINKTANEQYNKLLQTIEKFLLFSDLTPDNKIKINKIINENIKEEDKQKILSLQDF